jgi:hypothetical protein
LKRWPLLRLPNPSACSNMLSLRIEELEMAKGDYLRQECVAIEKGGE